MYKFDQTITDFLEVTTLRMRISKYTHAERIFHLDVTFLSDNKGSMDTFAAFGSRTAVISRAAVESRAQINQAKTFCTVQIPTKQKSSLYIHIKV